MNTSAATPLFLDYSFRLLPDDVSQGDLVCNLMQQSPNPLSVSFGTNTAVRNIKFKMRALGQLAAAEMNEISAPGVAGAISLQRTSSDLARASLGGLHLVVSFRGQNQYYYKGRRHLMPKGSFTFASNEAPVSGTFVNHHSICITLPTHWDRIGKLRLEEILWREFEMKNGCSSGLSTYLQRQMSQAENASSARFEEEFFDVLALELNPRAACDHGGGLLTLVRQYVDLHFREPGLSPTEVAATFNISLSYLHRLFARLDTTFGSYVTARRLVYAKDLLCAPHHAKRRILELAFDSGFNDINHFGRRFKDSFGCTPGEMRAASSTGQVLLLDAA